MDKKSFIENVKVLLSNKKSFRENAKEKYVQADGVARVEAYVGKDSLFNEFSNPEQPELSSSFIEYIEEKCYYVPYQYPIEIVLCSKDEIDVAYVQEKLKEYYGQKLIDKADDIKNNRAVAFSLLGLGVVLLSAYFILELLPNVNALFSELLSIVASFSIWESVDYALLNGGRQRLEYFNFAQLALTSVVKKSSFERS